MLPWARCVTWTSGSTSLNLLLVFKMRVIVSGAWQSHGEHSPQVTSPWGTLALVMKPAQPGSQRCCVCGKCLAASGLAVWTLSGGRWQIPQLRNELIQQTGRKGGPGTCVPSRNSRSPATNRNPERGCPSGPQNTSPPPLALLDHIPGQPWLDTVPKPPPSLFPGITPPGPSVPWSGPGSPALMPAVVKFSNKHPRAPREAGSSCSRSHSRPEGTGPQEAR